MNLYNKTNTDSHPNKTLCRAVVRFFVSPRFFDCCPDGLSSRCRHWTTPPFWRYTWPKQSESECENLRLPYGYSQIVYRPSTCAHTSLHAHVSLQRFAVETLVYLQHGRGNRCRQNVVTVIPLQT